MIWGAVMYVIRERIQVSESLDLISQFPLLLKGTYVHNGKYHEKTPLDINSIEGMKDQVKIFQEQYGERQFDWSKSTKEIISITLRPLNQYLPEEKMEHMEGKTPGEVQSLFP